MTQSMSRVAHCIDNGPMEGFWGILKRERYYGRRFTSKQEGTCPDDQTLHPLLQYQESPAQLGRADADGKARVVGQSKILCKLHLGCK